MVTDTAGFGAPLNLFIAGLPGSATWITDPVNGGGLSVQNLIIGSLGPATNIINASKGTSEITVEAWITADETSTNANGERIVSISSDASTRNITLNQVNAEYSAKLRAVSKDNDGNPSLDSTGSAVVPGQLTHIVFTRTQDGVETLYIRHAGLNTSFTQTAGAAGIGSLGNWDDSHALLLGNETTLNRAWSGTYFLVAFYSRALSAAEVQQNFLAGPN